MWDAARTGEWDHAPVDALAWLDSALAEHGIARTGDRICHQARPWSSAWRVPTTEGLCWFKQNGPGTRYEPALLRVLADSGVPGVPDVLAVHAGRGWSLTRDAGVPMRSLSDGDGSARWAEALGRYAQIQRRLEGQVGDLLAAKVPDSRPAMLPDLATALLDDEVAMRRGQPGGQDEATERRLRRLLPRFADWCAELAESPVAATIQHDDLHSNNVLVAADGRLTVIDWGDAQLAHPFATLLTTMRSIASHAGLAGPDDLRLAPLRDAYLASWTDVADPPRLHRDAALAVRVAPVARAHAWRRALLGASEAARSEFGEAVPGWLAELA